MPRLILALALAAVVVFALRWLLLRRARAVQGQMAPDTLPPDIAARLAERGRVLLYFYSPTCGACRSITPVVDRLAQEFDNVFKVDISQNTALPRSLGVMGTPSAISLAHGKVEEVVLGPVNEAKLRAMRQV